MKSTFWLYYGEKVVTAVRMAHDATPTQVIQKAFNSQQEFPTISHLWPDNSQGAILAMIARSTLRVFPNETF